MIWPYKGEALVSQDNFSRLEISVRHLKNDVMKIILPDTESREEHDATKYSPIGWRTAKLRAFLYPCVVKITEKE